MSRPYEVRQNIPAGRGVFATKDLKAGALVLQDKAPFAAALDSANLTTTCYWCFYFTQEVQGDRKVTVSACTGCKIARYCSKACQAASWKHSHKYECKQFKALYPQVLPNTVRLVIQILKRHTAKTIPEEDWIAFLELQHHMNELETGSRDAKRPDAEILQETLKNLQLMARAGKEYSGSSESLRHIESLLGRVITNTLTLVTPVFTPLGLCLSLPLSLLNHSCNPTCAIVYSGRSAELHVLDPVRPGTELTISYTHNTQLVQTRGSWLWTTYHFKCNCDQCLRGLTLNQPVNVLLAQSSLTPESQESLELEVGSYLAQAKTLPANEKLVLIAKAYKLFQSYSEYPAWLSPLYHVHLDLILALPENKQWVATFIRSTILHFKILPFVYPQAAHPARVARGWIYAKMANHMVHLAMDPDIGKSAMHMSREGELSRGLGTKFGLDWGMVVYALLKEVSDQVLKSHGLDNRLSLEVGKAMRHVKEEARSTRGEPSKDDIDKAVRLLNNVANDGWQWWMEEMRSKRQKLLISAAEKQFEDGISILLE